MKRKIKETAICIAAIIFLAMGSNSTKDVISKTEAIETEKSEESFEKDGYISDELYITIKDIYNNIDFGGYFKQCDTAKYEICKKIYREVLEGERKVRVSEKEEGYLWDIGEFAVDNESGKFDNENYNYYLFDMNGNGNPELCITDNARFIYVFYYEEESGKVIQWQEYVSNTIFLMGTRKLGFAGGWSGDGVISLDSSGNYEYFVRFKMVGGAPYKNEKEEYGYLISLPEYVVLSDDMKSQSVYDQADERYYFRVTEEQYHELTERYYEAVKNAHEQLEYVTYTYEEFWGTGCAGSEIAEQWDLDQVLGSQETISEEEPGEEIEMEQASLKKVEDGYELALYDKDNKKVYSELYPMPGAGINLPVIKAISDEVLEVSVSVGSPAVYIFFFDKKTAEISPTYFNPFVVENQYIAYMDDKNDILIFTDMFQKNGLMEIERNFTPYANPIEAVIDIKIIDSYHVELQYYEGENFEEKSEVILLDFK